MNKRLILFSCFIIGIIISFSAKNNYITIVSYNKTKFSKCPASGEICNPNGYNLLCHMTSPLGSYNITSEVCGENRNTHYGIDMTSSNKEVVNAIDGIVINVTLNDENCGWTLESGCGTCTNGGSLNGNSVTIQGTGIFSGYIVQYMHLKSINATILSYYNSSSQTIVKSGENIGIYGNTGCSSGAHLHFQVTDPNGNIVDTNAFFKDKSSIVCGISGAGGSDITGNYGSSCTGYVDSSSYNKIYADRILNNARSKIGQTYSGAGKCNGFVKTSYSSISSLGGTAAGIAESSTNKCVNFNDIKPGDVFFTSRYDVSGICRNCISKELGNRCDRFMCILHTGIVESVSANGIVTIIDNSPNPGVSSRRFSYNLSPDVSGNPWLIMVTRPYAN